MNMQRVRCYYSISKQAVLVYPAFTSPSLFPLVPILSPPPRLPSAFMTHVSFFPLPYLLL